MLSKIIALILCPLLMIATAPPVRGVRILASQFRGYDDESAGGFAMHKYAVWARVQNKKYVRLYPVAVHTSDVRRMKFKVLRITNGNRSIYAHVVDECDKRTHDCSVNYRLAKHMGALLTDLHVSSWKPLGLKTFGLHKLQGSVVGKVTRKQLERALTNDGKKGYVPQPWK